MFVRFDSSFLHQKRLTVSSNTVRKRDSKSTILVVDLGLHTLSVQDIDRLGSSHNRLDSVLNELEAWHF